MVSRPCSPSSRSRASVSAEFAGPGQARVQRLPGPAHAGAAAVMASASSGTTRRASRTSPSSSVVSRSTASSMLGQPRSSVSSRTAVWSSSTNPARGGAERPPAVAGAAAATAQHQHVADLAWCPAVHDHPGLAVCPARDHHDIGRDHADPLPGAGLNPAQVLGLRRLRPPEGGQCRVVSTGDEPLRRALSGRVARSSQARRSAVHWSQGRGRVTSPRRRSRSPSRSPGRWCSPSGWRRDPWRTSWRVWAERVPPSRVRRGGVSTQPRKRVE